MILYVIILNNYMLKYMKILLSIFTLFIFLHGNAQIQPPAGMGSNMILWLSPDSGAYQSPGNPAGIGDVVNEWHDISGGGFTFTTTQGPTMTTYQGKNMLDFNGGDFLENTAIASSINGLSEFSVYIVIKSDNNDTDNGFLNSKNPNGADEVLGMRYDRSGANTGRTKLLKCGMQNNTANNQIESQSNTQTTNLQVLSLTWKAGEKINLYIDGVLNESSVNSIGTNMNNIQKILIGKGAKNTASNSGWDGRIGTTIFYDKKMSPDSVSLISSSLSSIVSIATGNWEDPNTWDCNCNPPNNSFVKIRNNHVVSLTQNETVRNVIIQPQGTLSLTNNNWQLRVKRNFTNNGTLNSFNGKIKFIGSQKQYINGSAATEYYNFHINNSAGVEITNGTANIQGSLYLQNGCLETGNRVTLLSNAAGTGRLAKLSGSACITGDITMQRYVNPGSATWRYLTSAVTGTTIADFNDNFTTSGFIGSNHPPTPTTPNPWVSIYTYNESEPGIIDSGFVAATNVTNSIGVGQGFWAYISETQAFTIDVTGPPNVGNINLPVSYTNNGTPSEDGWNMVGNPYPSTINWDSPNITKTNINAAIYIWNADQQQFASYVSPFGTNGGSKNIASTQAFWVQANGSGANIQLTESCKAGADASFLKQNSIQPLRLKSHNSFGSDELIINLELNATNAFDINYDAKKINSSNPFLPTISSITNGIDCSINQLAPQEISIPIKILSGASGTQNITIENASSFNNSSCLILEDVFNNTFYNLSLVDSFSTYIYDTTQTARFLLHIGAPVDIETTNVSAFGNNDGKIIYTKDSNSSFDIVWKDNSNNVLQSNSNIFTSDSLINLTAGTYYVETTDLICGNNTDTIIINEPSQTTSIDNQYLSYETKVWINNNNLHVSGKNISNITVRNLLGQVLFSSFNKNSNTQLFNLSQLSSQVLIISSQNNNKVSTVKVSFVNSNN